MTHYEYELLERYLSGLREEQGLKRVGVPLITVVLAFMYSFVGLLGTTLLMVGLRVVQPDRATLDSITGPAFGGVLAIALLVSALCGSACYLPTYVHIFDQLTAGGLLSAALAPDAPSAMPELLRINWIEHFERKGYLSRPSWVEGQALQLHALYHHYSRCARGLGLRPFPPGSLQPALISGLLVIGGLIVLTGVSDPATQQPLLAHLNEPTYLLAYWMALSVVASLWAVNIGMHTLALSSALIDATEQLMRESAPVELLPEGDRGLSDTGWS